MPSRATGIVENRKDSNRVECSGMGPGPRHSDEVVCIISPLRLSTQLGTRVPSYSASSNSGGVRKSRLIGINHSVHIQVTTPAPTLASSHPRTRSPEDWRLSTGQLLNCVPEDAEMSVEQTRTTSRSETLRARMTQRSFGSTPVTGYPASLEIYNENELDEEEEEFLLDDELAKSGLYRGSYKRILLLYSFVPLTTLLTFVILAFLPVLAFHSSAPSTFPYPPYLPYPIPEVLTASAFWSLSYLLRDILYKTSLFLTSWIPISPRLHPNFTPFVSSLLAANLQNASALVFRLLIVSILLIPLYSSEKPLFSLYTPNHKSPTWQDVAFRRVWWVALGWAAAEAVVGIKQGYEEIALYKDVLVHVRKQIREENFIPTSPIASAEVTVDTGPVGTSDRAAQKSSEGKRLLANREAHITVELPRRRDHSSSLSSIASGPYDDLPTSPERQPLLPPRRQTIDNLVPTSGHGTQTNDAHRELVESLVEQDLQELICLKSREELEVLYGMPVIQIPVFIFCLHRINSILASLAACLILSATYMRSKLAYDYSGQGSSLPGSTPNFQLFFPPIPGNHSVIQSSESSFSPSNYALVISFTVLLSLHTIFSMLHTAWILPYIGVHTFVYASLLVWLGLFFVALGFWEVLS